MARYTFRMQRLYIDHPLMDGAEVSLDKAQSNYLINVLRMKPGDPLLVFNGRDGEWQAALTNPSKKVASLTISERLRPQPSVPTLDYLFAPLKQARLDYMVQKAVEMGAGRLRPVLTDHTQVNRINLDRMRANVIEAAEQCGILTIPEVLEPLKLQDVLTSFPSDNRHLIFCDEENLGDDPAHILRQIEAKHFAILIGPEGGFSQSERTFLRSHTFVTSIPLGPRILRADTAAVAALSLYQATIGDWIDDA